MAREALVRFGVAMEASLLEELDRLVEERGGTRSELLRDLARAEVTRSQVHAGAPAVAALTLVYDHHVRDLTEKLTEFQHELGDKVNSALHVHLDHDHCLEVVVMRGPADELKRAGDKILATRGVKHGGMELIAVGPAARRPGEHTHVHYHDGIPHVHGHTHDGGDHEHTHAHDHHHHHPHAAPTPARRAAKRAPPKRG